MRQVALDMVSGSGIIAVWRGKLWIVPAHCRVNGIWMHKKELTMSVPSKANIGKLDNPARLKINHQAVTAPGV